MVDVASLLAGETFSDRPRCVSPVIRAFLHDYNDGLDYRRRQELLRCATDITGTRGPRGLERTRTRVCRGASTSSAVARRNGQSSACGEQLFACGRPRPPEPWPLG